MSVSVSDSVRMAMKKAGLRQRKLAELWGTTPQAIYNKLNLERWTGTDLARIAQITGGKLMFVYPDGQQIPIDPVVEPEKPAEKPEKKVKAPAKPKQAKAPAKAQKKKTPAKPKQAKEPEMREEQISFFN